MNKENKKNTNFGTILIVLSGLVLLIFLPLLFSMIEYTIFKTTYVEDFFRILGLYEVLGEIYESLFTLLNI